MQKKPQQISYAVAKAAFGIYLVNELREACGKELPTETDVRKFLLKINPACTATELQTARQISRYCQTGKDYLREAREETLDKVAKLLNTPIRDFEAFREKINPLLKAFKYYSGYVDEAGEYLHNLEKSGDDEGKKKFYELFSCNGQTKVFLSMISYNFGEENKDLPAVSFGAESDRRTERVMLELFDSYGLPSPQYVPGDVFFDTPDKQSAQTNFIAIGLFGNRLTEWMNDNNLLANTLQVLPAEKCIALHGKKYYTDRENNVDYALFCKKTLPNKSTVLIIGGIEGYGTQRMGEYLEDSWRVVHELTAGHEDFTLLFETASQVTLVDKII
ncbi:MAG TPA: hypothetical protein VG738_01880 [Chitinophagaceae bacterium]|nr:hypothetical protein [Chitinophagaceae bacterium]